eukprot:15341244-Ditylum_brightwellii.AAC.1
MTGLQLPLLPLQNKLRMQVQCQVMADHSLLREEVENIINSTSHDEINVEKDMMIYFAIKLCLNLHQLSTMI